MKAAPRILRLALLAGFGVATLGASVLAFAALQPAPPAEARHWKLAPALGREADQALAAPTPDFARAEAATRLALERAPYDNAARMKLAYLTAKDGQPSPETLEALERSYQLLPYDHYVAIWRIGFALENWQHLPPEIKKSVEAEAFAFAQSARRSQLMAMLREIRSPYGVVPATFWRIRMQAEAQLRRAREASEAPAR